MTIKIEKNIPIKPAGGRGKCSPFPWAGMIEGDSFFVGNISRTEIQNAVNYRKNRYDELYAIRKVDNGFRVWRIK